MTNPTAAQIIDQVLPQKQATYTYNSRSADKFVVRFPDGMREKIAAIAKANHRSMNSEVINKLDLCIKLDEMGHGTFLQELSNGLKSPDDLDIQLTQPVAQSPNTAPLRAGDPVSHDGTAWIITKLTARMGNVYATIEREDPSDASKTDSTDVRYSALKHFQG